MPKKQAKELQAAMIAYAIELAAVEQEQEELDEETEMYRRYNIAFNLRPKGYIPCHNCVKKGTEVGQKIISHHRDYHPGCTFACDSCRMLFRSAGEAGKHHYSVHKA